MAKSLYFLVLSAMVSTVPAQISFDSSLESGNGTNFQQMAPNSYTFAMEDDTNSTDKQWFFFEVSGAQGETVTFRLTNSGAANVPSHWSTAVPVASPDGGATWERINGSTSNSPSFTFSHTMASDAELIAFHYPYTFAMIQEKLAEWDTHPDVTRSTIGQSVQSRPIELLRITEEGYTPAGGKLGFWFVTRQHAAEVTSNYTLEGLLDFVLSDDPIALGLRRYAVFNIVPMANPDGVVAGNYRDNFQGINLNRVWNGTATLTDSPEIVVIEEAIQDWVDSGNSYVFFADLHSTSGRNPHFAFHAGPSMTPPVLYPTPETYHQDSVAFLQLVNMHAPHFAWINGTTNSADERIAYHDQRVQYGPLAFTFEGAYNDQNYGPNSGAYMTRDTHRLTGEGIARALAEHYGMEPVTREAWMLY